MLLHRLTMVLLLAHALVRYDAFVFRAGDSFLGLRDLPLLRRFGKHVVVVFFGSDSRPSYLNGVEVASGRTGSRAADQTLAKRRVVERIERHATTIVCHVMSAQLHRRRAVAFLEIGIPRAIGTGQPSVARRGGPLRLLHAPSAPLGKGTDEVREAVAAAKDLGVDVELVILTGRPNREVIAELARCDFVVDQVYGDTPMAGFAAEAASLGRPAVVGGHGWDELTRMTSPEALPPSHLCRPDELAGAIATLASDGAYRRELGERARRFVGERWTPAEVARRFMVLMSGDVPEHWTFDPASVAYAGGVGMSEPAISASIRSVLEAEGTAGLHVGDKPRLERLLVDLAARR